MSEELSQWLALKKANFELNILGHTKILVSFPNLAESFAMVRYPPLLGLQGKHTMGVQSAAILCESEKEIFIILLSTRFEYC